MTTTTASLGGRKEQGFSPQWRNVRQQEEREEPLLLFLRPLEVAQFKGGSFPTTDNEGDEEDLIDVPGDGLLLVCFLGLVESAGSFRSSSLSIPHPQRKRFKLALF